MTQGRSEAIKRKILRLAMRGRTCTEIAAAAGISRQYVFQVLAAKGMHEAWRQMRQDVKMSEQLKRVAHAGELERLREKCLQLGIQAAWRRGKRSNYRLFIDGTRVAVVRMKPSRVGASKGRCYYRCRTGDRHILALFPNGQRMLFMAPHRKPFLVLRAAPYKKPRAVRAIEPLISY